MSRPFAVEGFEVADLLAVGAGSEVWRARDLRTGDEVALKRLPGPVDPVAQERLRQEAALLEGLAHPHVLRLRSVLEHPDGVVLVLDLAAGGSLAGLVAARGRLAPAEVVTVGVAVAGALAAVHAAGLVHGDVTPANVLLTADGRPLLADLGEAVLRGAASPRSLRPPGTPGYLDPAGAGGPAGDVHGLAATCLAALRGFPPYDHAGRRRPAELATGGEPVAALLERVLGTAPADRPDAAALAVALFESHPAGPVVLASSRSLAAAALLSDGEVGVDLAPPTRRTVRPAATAAARPAPRRGGSHRRPSAPVTAGERARPRRLPRRAVGVAVLATLGLVGAAAAGLAWAGTGPPPGGGHTEGAATVPAPERPVAATTSALEVTTTPADGSTTTGERWSRSVDWQAVLAALDRARAVAYAKGDEHGLQAVYAARSPAGRRDRAALRRLVAQGLVAHGVRVVTREVAVAGQDQHGVRLRVLDVLGSYRLVDRSGVVVAERAGRGPARWSVTLLSTPVGWRVYDVLRL